MRAREPDLPSGHGDRRAAQGVERNGEQGGGDAFAGGQQQVDLAPFGAVRDFPRHPEQLVGFARHGGDDHHYFFSRLLHLGDAAGHVLDAFDSADGRAAVFLYNQSGH